MTTAYADYTYYTGTYLGTKISSSDFAAIALRASAIIDQLTYNRASAVTTPAEQVDAIKMAMCAVADVYYDVTVLGEGAGIVSESIGQFSVTYSENSEKRLTSSEKYSEAARLYLGQYGLMFPGFVYGEYGQEVA